MIPSIITGSGGWWRFSKFVRWALFSSSVSPLILRAIAAGAGLHSPHARDLVRRCLLSNRFRAIHRGRR